MAITGAGKRVMIAIDEADHWQHTSLANAIVERIKAEGGAGATVLKGIEGFGAHSRIHTAGLVDLSVNLPILIVWVDTSTSVDRILPSITTMVPEGLITVEPVEIVRYQHRDEA